VPSTLPLVPSIPNYRVSTQLGETQYILDVRWNTRAASWYMDIRTEDDELIRAGMRLVLGARHGARITDTRFPAGFITAEDTSGTHSEAGLDDMGTRVVVNWYSAEELATLAALLP
jgi:hypothetical protein